MNTKPFTKNEIAKMRDGLELIIAPSAGYFTEFRQRVIATIDAQQAEIDKLKQVTQLSTASNQKKAR